MGLPNNASGALTIDPATGVISGMYDAFGNQVFNVTVAAHPTGSRLSIAKSFVLSIRDDG